MKGDRMDNQQNPGFYLGEWRVSPSEGILNLKGEETRLEPKVMEVLEYLASRPGEVVTRDDLEREVWHGGLVGYDAVTRTIIKLRKALGDSAKQPEYIATIPKRGYQLIVPVTSVALSTQEENVSFPSNAIDNNRGKRRPSWWSPWLMGIFALVLLSLLVANFWHSAPLTSESGEEAAVKRQSIVVIPFRTMGESQHHAAFADGISEDIITDLSGLSGLAVIASNTAFTFKDTEFSAREVGEKLKVDYVLDGSIRRVDEAFRINTQLVEAATGYQKWAGRYDGKVGDIFEVQDTVTSNIVEALALNLTREEVNRLQQQATGILAAYDHFLQGQRLSRVGTRETSIQSEEAYRKAIQTDPRYGRAFGALAYTLAYRYRRGWTDAPVQTIDRALELARKAVEFDSTIPQTYWALGYVYLMRKEFDQAEAAVEAAIAVSPNYADGYGLLALIKNAKGEGEAAIRLINRGKQLNPYFTWDYPYNLGRAYYSLGHIEEAIAALENARMRNENAVPVRLHLAASYARAGRQDDAEWEVEELQVLSPTDTIQQLKDAHPITDDKLFLEFLDDLRKAGLPEQ